LLIIIIIQPMFFAPLCHYSPGKAYRRARHKAALLRVPSAEPCQASRDCGAPTALPAPAPRKPPSRRSQPHSGNLCHSLLTGAINFCRFMGRESWEQGTGWKFLHSSPSCQRRW